MLNIRNFSIVAHIDHGKSTLADRFIERLNAIPQREMKEQVMDRMELERERGITIKSKTIRMDYRAKDGTSYVLNLIDTPGHMDFSFEVSKALFVSDGVILLIDAADGIGAQTVAHAMLSKKLGLKIIPVINKIDLPTANIDMVKNQIRNVLNLEGEIYLVSAKFGFGVDELVDVIIRELPPPRVYNFGFPSGTVFDSYYDRYHGVVMFVKVLSGEMRVGDRIKFSSNGAEFSIEEVGEIRWNLLKSDRLSAGDVGYIIAGIKDIHAVEIGDIFYVGDKKPQIERLLEKTKSFVFADVYPLNPADYPTLKSSIEKLYLTDASFTYSVTHSEAFGPGFNCGFLGALHLEIFKERLIRDYNLNVIFTHPSVMYEVVTKSGEVKHISNVSKIPPSHEIAEIREPYIKGLLVTPLEHLSNVIETAKKYRAENIDVKQTDPNKVVINCDMPLSEIMVGFYNELKSCSRGLASFDYTIAGYKPSELVKLTTFVKGQPIEALSFLVHKSKSYAVAKNLAERLKDLIPRHLFDIPIQIKENNKVIAREDIRAIRKDVLAKCYGGDVTRKLKLLQKQKEGKKRMKKFGEVDIPPEVFSELLKL